MQNQRHPRLGAVVLDELTSQTDVPWPAETDSLEAKLERSLQFISTGNYPIAEVTLGTYRTLLDQASEHGTAEWHHQMSLVLSANNLAAAALKHAEEANLISNRKRYDLQHKECLLHVLSDENNADGIRDVINSITTDEIEYQRLRIIALLLLQEYGEAEKHISACKDEDIAPFKANLLLNQYKFKECEQYCVDIIREDIISPKFKLFLKTLLIQASYFDMCRDMGVYGKKIPLSGIKEIPLDRARKLWEETKRTWEDSQALGFPLALETILAPTLIIGSYLDCLDDVYAHIKEFGSRFPIGSNINTQLVQAASLIGDERYLENTYIQMPMEKLTGITETAILWFFTKNRYERVCEIAEKTLDAILKSKSPNHDFTVVLICVAAEKCYKETLLADSKKAIDALDNRDELHALADFLNSISASEISTDKALQTLFNQYQNGVRGIHIIEQLFHNLPIKNHEQDIITLAQDIQAYRAIHKDERLRLAQA